jgi:NADH-quinone oxidoreductase subunit F
MDIRLRDAEASGEERVAVDAVLGPPTSQWDGGERGSLRDAHTAHGGREVREKRHLLLPALQALQARVGWVSEGGLNYVCERLAVPPAEAWGVATFYALIATEPRPQRVVHVCDDIGCRARGARELCAELEKAVGPAHHAPEGDHAHTERPAWMPSPCLGMCDAGPAALMTEAGSKPREKLVGGATVETVQRLLRGDTGVPGGSEALQLPQKGDPSLVLLKRAGVVDATSLSAYREAGGYQALPRAIELGPERVIAEVIASGLLGRGGAAFPTGRKWEAVRKQKATPRYLVCNADESEPGTFKDRALLVGDPFAVIEAMTIAALAAGCEKGYLYVRAEYPVAHARLTSALQQARAAGLLGRKILQSDLSFDIELRRGAGAYICGEETALFESIEGRRGEPRRKPPFPVEQGLFGKPTVVNNVETLVNVLPIVMDGGAAFAKVGTEKSTGTRLFCLSGNVDRPGVYEVPMGTPLRRLLELAGGPADLQAVLLGGAAGTFIRPDEIDLPLTMEHARAANTTLGSGVVMVFDGKQDLKDAVLRISSFFRDESCGQCVPCRVGTVRQDEALRRLTEGKTRGDELRMIDEVGVAMRDASICGLGQTAYSAVESAVHRLKLFGETARFNTAPAPKATALPRAPSAELVELTVDGRAVAVKPGSTVLDAAHKLGIEVPTLCWLETLDPANTCRMCVVEVEGARVLSPSCARPVEPGMVVHTQSERVRHSRRLVLELLGSSVDLSTAPDLQRMMKEYGADPARHGPPLRNGHGTHPAGHHEVTDPSFALTVLRDPKVDNDLYVRDYAKCVLCYKCVQACGDDHQNTFAIAVAGRGFDAHISTELDAPLTDSACVYCGNCIAVCPTGALVGKIEYDMRAAGTWAPEKQSKADTICPYCGVGCTLSLTAQDGKIVRADSPLDASVTEGNLCIKGRFGWRFVNPA